MVGGKPYSDCNPCDSDLCLALTVSYLSHPDCSEKVTADIYLFIFFMFKVEMDRRIVGEESYAFLSCFLHFHCFSLSRLVVKCCAPASTRVSIKLAAQCAASGIVSPCRCRGITVSLSGNFSPGNLE